MADSVGVMLAVSMVVTVLENDNIAVLNVMITSERSTVLVRVPDNTAVRSEIETVEK